MNSRQDNFRAFERMPVVLEVLLVLEAKYPESLAVACLLACPKRTRTPPPTASNGPLALLELPASTCVVEFLFTLSAPIKSVPKGSPRAFLYKRRVMQLSLEELHQMPILLFNLPERRAISGSGRPLIPAASQKREASAAII